MFALWRWLTGRSHNRREFDPVPLMILYAVIALITFGYDAAVYPNPPCAEDDYSCGNTPNDIPGIKPAFAGAFWPLFWTWEAAEAIAN
jgi:hypothetical protein